MSQAKVHLSFDLSCHFISLRVSCFDLIFCTLLFIFFLFFAIKIENAASDSFLGRTLFASLWHCNCNPIAGATQKTIYSACRKAHFVAETGGDGDGRRAEQRGVCEICAMRGTSTEISRIADSRSFVRLRVCVCVCRCVSVCVCACVCP